MTVAGAAGSFPARSVRSLPGSPIAFVAAVTFTGTLGATLPVGWQPGDLAVGVAARDGGTGGDPTAPGGWTTVVGPRAGGLWGLGQAGNRTRVAYRVLKEGDTTTGIWANAQDAIVHIYRGATGIGNAGGGDTTTNAGTVLAYDAVQLAGRRSWWMAAGFTRCSDACGATPEVPPAGMVNRSHRTGTKQLAGHDTNGHARQDWPASPVNIGGSSFGWTSPVIELVA